MTHWPDDAIGGTPFWEREKPGAITRIMQDQAQLKAKFDEQRRRDDEWLQRHLDEPRLKKEAAKAKKKAKHG